MLRRSVLQMPPLLSSLARRSNCRGFGSSAASPMPPPAVSAVVPVRAASSIQQSLMQRRWRPSGGTAHGCSVVRAARTFTAAAGDGGAIHTARRWTSSAPPPAAAASSSSPTSGAIVKVMRAVAVHLWPKNNWKLRACVVGSIVFMFAAKLTRVAVPFWFRSVIDTLAPTTVAAASATVGPLTVGVFGLVVAYGITRLTTSFTDEMKGALFAPVGAHATTQVSMDMFRKMHKLDLAFHLNRQTGVLSKDMDRGSRAFWALAYAMLFMIIPTAFEMVLVCGALQSQAGPSFVATALIAVASYIGWTYVVSNWRAKYRDAYNKAESRVGGMMVDSLLNYETIKYFGREEYEQSRIGAQTTRTNEYLSRLDQSMALLNFGQQAIFTIAATSSLYFSTSAVLAGTMTVGDLVLVDALLMQLYTPLSWLGILYREVQTSTQNMEAMLKLMEQKNSVTERPDAPEFALGNGTIELKDVCFSYDSVIQLPPHVKDGSASHAEVPVSDGSALPAASNVVATEPDGSAAAAALSRPVLNKLSLTIPGGSCVAFVGPSGCGKTTIFRLLFRFFDPTSGTVLVDGQDLKDVALPSFRSHVGVIPQDTVLFYDTVLNNIRYGRLDATTEECEAAAKAANVHDSILRMTDGYQALVGERGLKLSGGEKQRVSIARAFLHDPPILLADEATSALDSKTETSVMHTLRHATSMRPSMRTSSTTTTPDGASDEDGGGRRSPSSSSPRSRTIVMIAHRLTTIQSADIIFVLDGKGGLAEQGTHNELLARNGLYHSLWFQQQHDKVDVEGGVQ